MALVIRIDQSHQGTLVKRQRTHGPHAGWWCVLLLVSAMAMGAEKHSDLVLNAQVKPHWMEGGKQFWYRRQATAASFEFMLVDAVAGTRAVAFDHALMAEALGKAVNKKLDAADLPITDVKVVDGGRTLVIASDGRWWEGPRATLNLIASTRGPKPAVEYKPRPTRNTGEAMSAVFVNRTKGDVELMWSDTNGERKSYAHVAPGGESQQNTFAGHVWIAVDKSGGILGVFEVGAGNQRFEIDDAAATKAPARQDQNLSPDGKWQAFIRNQNMWLRPIAGGESVAMSKDGTKADHYDLPVAWSPDSTHFACLRVQNGDRRMVTLVESSPKDQLQPKTKTIPYAKPGDRIDTPRPYLFRVADHIAITVDVSLLENPWSIDDLAWNPDGGAFTLRFNQRGHQVQRVVEIDRNGKARAIIDERSPTFFDYAYKLFYHPLASRREILWMSERDGWNHLYRYDAVTGQVKNHITKGEWVMYEVERVDDDAGLIWFTAGGMVSGEDPYYVHHARVAFDGSGLTRLTDGDGTHTVQWSPDRRWLIDTWSRVDAPPQHVLRDGNTGKQVVTLEQADISALVATGWQPPERFVAKGRDGTTDIYGVLWRPKDFAATTSYPIVENIYAGPQGAEVPKAFSPRNPYQQNIADLGFVVGTIDGMGTSRRSKAFHDVCWKNLADAGFSDRIPWWKAAAVKRPWMDLSRVGIHGGSAGGQNALGALLFHPEFYKVAVADCGCHDNRMDKIWWNELWMGWPIGPQYAESSNVTHAAKLQGKLMLIVGEIDDNVDPASTFQVAHALEKAGKDFELVVVQGARHGAAETPFGSMKRAGFLVRHLLGRER